MANHLSTLRLGYVLTGAAAMGLGACAGILGIDDRTLEAGTSPPLDAPGPDVPTSQDGPVSSVDTGTDAGSIDASACATDPCLLASKLNHPFLMTSDSASVFWTEYGTAQGSGDGFVKGCPLSGCGAGPTVYAAGLTNPRGIAVDAQNVYFGTASYGGVVGGIWRCALSGCNGSPTNLASAGIPYGVAVDGTFVYWVDFDDNTVHKVNKTGGADTVLYDAASGLIVEPGQCVVYGPFLFLVDANADALRVATSGGEPALIGTSTYGGQYGLATDPSNVYFGGNGVVFRAAQTSVDAAVPIAQTIADPTGLAFDPTSGMVYWSNWGSGNGNDGTVGKMAADGGSPHLLATALASPEAVTVSGSYAFWLSNGTLSTSGSGTDPNTGALYRTAK
jgi:hypothetical protein